MYFIELKYAGFLGAFSFLEQNCGIRKGNTFPLIIGPSLKCFRKILTLSWQRLESSMIASLPSTGRQPKHVFTFSVV